MEAGHEMKFVVYGTPIPQGSLKAFMPKGAKFPTITSDNPKTRPWRQQIAQTALCERETQLGGMKTGESVEVNAYFFFERPKSAKKIINKVTRPDLDKLVRAVLDSLTGILFADDSQVTAITAGKTFGSPARVEIEVR